MKQEILVSSTCIDMDSLLDGYSPSRAIQNIEDLVKADIGNSIIRRAFRTSYYGYDGAFDLYLDSFRLETEEEYELRLKKESTKRAVASLAEKKKLEKERIEYERLKKKFGD